MENTSPTINRILFTVCGIAFAVPSLFFTYYTIRLLYVNLTTVDAAVHRTDGMLIGAVAFPLAAILFGLFSWFFLKRARKSRPR